MVARKRGMSDLDMDNLTRTIKRGLEDAFLGPGRDPEALLSVEDFRGKKAYLIEAHPREGTSKIVDLGVPENVKLDYERNLREDAVLVNVALTFAIPRIGYHEWPIRSRVHNNTAPKATVSRDVDLTNTSTGDRLIRKKKGGPDGPN